MATPSAPTDAEQAGEAGAEPVAEAQELELEPEPLDREALLRQIFADVDANSDGSIDVDEYKRLAASQSPMAMSMQEAVFAMVDENSDGTLSLDEFIGFNLETGAALSDDGFRKQVLAWQALAKVRTAEIAAAPIDLEALFAPMLACHALAPLIVSPEELLHPAVTADLYTTSAADLLEKTYRLEMQATLRLEEKGGAKPDTTVLDISSRPTQRNFYDDWYACAAAPPIASPVARRLADAGKIPQRQPPCPVTSVRILWL